MKCICNKVISFFKNTFSVRYMILYLTMLACVIYLGIIIAPIFKARGIENIFKALLSIDVTKPYWTDITLKVILVLAVIFTSSTYFVNIFSMSDKRNN